MARLPRHRHRYAVPAAVYDPGTGEELVLGGIPWEPWTKELTTQRDMRYGGSDRVWGGEEALLGGTPDNDLFCRLAWERMPGDSPVVVFRIRRSAQQ